MLIAKGVVVTGHRVVVDGQIERLERVTGPVVDMTSEHAILEAETGELRTFR